MMDDDAADDDDDDDDGDGDGDDDDDDDDGDDDDDDDDDSRMMTMMMMMMMMMTSIMHPQTYHIFGDAPPPSHFDLVLQVKAHFPKKTTPSSINCFMLNKTLLLHLYISALMWDCGSKSLLNIFY